jgi:hypothetical protein
MDPLIFEFLGGLFGGALAGLTIVLRTRHPPPKTIPMLAVRKPRSASSVRRRRTSAFAEKGSRTISLRNRKKARTKAPVVAVETSQAPTIVPPVAVSFETCPSCGLQAPGSLLAEHFLGSPSHKNGLPEIAKADIVEVAARAEAKEEDTKQSVRNLLQMLVPPRAFGRRHAHRTMGPISSIVKDLRPPPRNYP